MKRPYGVTPAAFAAYIRACFFAKVNPGNRVMQTIGAASASAGTHAQDGTLTIDGVDYDYTAAIDLRTKDLSESQIKALVRELAKQGFAAWYRHEGSFSGNRHIHAIWCSVPMKPSLRAQVVDYLNGRTGLVGHKVEKFYTAPKSIDVVLAQAFVQANPKAHGEIPKGLLA